MSRIIDLKTADDHKFSESSSSSNLVDISQHSSMRVSPITPITPITPNHQTTTASESKSNEYDFMFSKLLESQIKISQQLEQITSTMAIMSHALTKRIEAESYLTYQKLKRLEDAMSLSEVDSRSAVSESSSSIRKKHGKSVSAKK